MTKEINDIITAFNAAQLHGRRTALATVVHVEGSSYRRPGARMLVEDNGRLTGAISGGCLEGDALKKALLAIEQQQNKLVTYNTNYEDDAEFGIQLGCNGIVHILFEPIDATQPINPISILEKFSSQRRNVVLGTLFSLEKYYGQQPGTCFLYDGENYISEIGNKNVEASVKSEAISALQNKASSLLHDDVSELTAFVEFIQPPVSLIVVGAGNDVLPIVDMATILGWQITIVDGRVTHANRQRFPKAHKLIVGKPEEISRQLVSDEQSVFVLMTHNYNYDLEILTVLLKEQCKYIGILGPMKKLERMLSALREDGISITDEQLAHIYGPTGLDIGAETSEEIALSVLAEIKAVITGRSGSFLRERSDEIHTRSQSLMSEQK